jgi:hypothetical protein
MGKVMLNQLAFIYHIGWSKPLRVAEEELRVTELGLVEFGEQLHISNPHIAVQNIKHLQLHKVSERCVNLPPTNGSLIRK